MPANCWEKLHQVEIRITSYNVCYTKLLRNSGTTFILKFKQGKDHFQTEEIFEETCSLHLEKEVKIEPIPSEPNYQLNKILVIEDHEDLRSYIEKILWEIV